MSAQNPSIKNIDSSQASEASQINSDSQDVNSPERKTGDRYQGLFDAMDRRLNHQSAYINKLEKTVKGLTELSAQSKGKAEAEKENKDDEKVSANLAGDDLTKRVKELEDRQRVLDATAERQKLRAKLQEIRASLEAEGVAAKNAERFAKLISVEQGDAITIDDNNGDYLIRVRQGDGFSSLADWTHAYLQTDEGQAFLPPKQNPVRGNAARGQTVSGAKKITEEEAQHIDPKDLISGKYQIE